MVSIGALGYVPDMFLTCSRQRLTDIDVPRTTRDSDQGDSDIT